MTLHAKESEYSPDKAEWRQLYDEASRYYTSGDYAQAVQLGTEALVQAETHLGTNHPSVATILNGLAEAYFAQELDAEAEPYLTRALKIRKEKLDSEHEDLATSLNNLGTLYTAQGRFAEAEPLYLHALTIREKNLELEHPDVAQTLTNLAIVYDAQNLHTKAEPLYQRSLGIREKTLGPEHLDVATSLNSLAILYHNKGRHTEAEPLYLRSLLIREKSLGINHPDVAQTLTNLAIVYDAQNLHAKAEPLYQRSLAIREKTLGPEHLDVATSLNSLAILYHNQGRYAEAEPLLQRSLEILEKAGAEHHDVANSLNNLALLYRAQGRYVEAEPLHQRSLAIGEKVLGPEHPDMATSLSNLAELYADQGRYAEAEPLHQRSLAIAEKVLGPEHPDVATSLNNLAGLYGVQGRYVEAEPLHQRSLAIGEKVLGPEHPDVANSLNNLAVLYADQGRYAEAELLYRRSLVIREKMLSPEHPDVAHSINNLAVLYSKQGRYAEAEPLLRQSLSINEKVLGPEHPDVATGLNNLAELFRLQSRYTEAEPLLSRSKQITEKVLGPQHPDMTLRLVNLAKLHRDLGQFDKAEPLYQSAMAIAEKTLGPAHPSIARILAHLGDLYNDQKNTSSELFLRRRALSIDAQHQRKEMAGKHVGIKVRENALHLLTLLANLKILQVKDEPDALAAMQLAHRSNNVGVFQLLAQRLAVGGQGELAERVRQRQDLLGQLKVAEKRLLDSFGLKEDQQPAKQRERIRARIEDLQQRERAVREGLQRDFPAYTEFEGSQIVELDALQSLLKPNEAALAWVLGAEKSFLLVVRKDRDLVLHALPVGPEPVGQRVQQIHQALDLANPEHEGELGAFPAGLSFALFQQLFGQGWQQELEGIDHLLLVPEGPLTRLPFATLLTEKPDHEDFPADSPSYRNAPWLARRFSLSVLPSLSAIVALRSQEFTTPADQPFLGVGDPLLEGHPATTLEVQLAGAAPSPILYRNAGTLKQMQQQLDPVADLRTTRLRLLKKLPAIPDTADELMAIAEVLGTDRHQALLLREKATETELKRRQLAQYNILSFATHGVLAGELGKGIEPGLILSPPKQATEEDDGFLSLSEIAQLKLNADWVVLSACNTAGSEGDEGMASEGFTGLAKSFIYAGAKALLVSHWSVSSAATVELMSTMFRSFKEQQLPRAEAHRQAMLAMIDSGDPLLSHPSLWAPFVVVGDGG